MYEKNADSLAYPASMTKMMTCLLGIEHRIERQLMTITPTAAKVEDSPLGLLPAEQLTGYELLMGMMLVSDNGAAYAIAENISGSVKVFAELMNDKAKEIGAYDTHFVNPNGLPDPAHYSTARDMARIAAYCWQYEDFRDIVGRSQETIFWSSPRGKFYVAENTNELLDKYSGMNGIKTGWTNAAGGCLAAAAKRDGIQLIAIIMHANDTSTRFADAVKLLDYGFSQVRLKKGLTKEKASCNVFVTGGKEYKIAVAPSEDIYYPLIGQETAKKYTLAYDIPRVMPAPIEKGQQLGNIIIKYGGREIQRMPLFATDSSPAGFSVLSLFVGLIGKVLHMV